MTARPTTRRRPEATEAEKEAQKAAAQARRAQLSALSGPIQTGRKLGILPFAIFPTTNAALEFLYAKATGTEALHTFHGWRDLGYMVRKGSTGHPIWSAPQKGQRTNEETGEREESDKEYFRLAYLFDSSQVEPIPGQEPEPIQPTVPIAAIEAELRAADYDPAQIDAARYLAEPPAPAEETDEQRAERPAREPRPAPAPRPAKPEPIYLF